MLKKVVLRYLFPWLLIISACEDEEAKKSEGIEVITDDINFAPALYSFTDQSFGAETYDLKFFYGPYLVEGVNYGSYYAGLNSAVVVKAAVDTAHDFDSAELPITWCIGVECPPYPDPGLQMDVYDETDGLDSMHYAIGANWADLSTYGSVPNHGILSFDSLVYFIHSANYEWAKFAVDQASPDSFYIKYAIQNKDGSFATTQQTKIGGYTTERYYNYVYFDFTTGAVIEPQEWHIGFVASPVYSEELESLQYVPYVLINYDIGVQVAILQDKEFDGVTEVPSGVTWLSDPDEFLEFGYQGSREVLVYHPEPPYNHKVIVEHPEYVYLIKTETATYKLHFPEEDSYSSGVLLFVWQEL